MEGERLFLDTNVLINALVRDMPRHAEAKELLLDLESSEHEVWISRQVIREFLSALSRPQGFTRPLPTQVLLPAAQELESQFLIAEDGHLVTAQLLLLLEGIACGGKQLHDANIVATMMTYGIPWLFTYNGEDFRRFEPFIDVREGL